MPARQPSRALGGGCAHLLRWPAVLGLDLRATRLSRTHLLGIVSGLDLAHAAALVTHILPLFIRPSFEGGPLGRFANDAVFLAALGHLRHL